LHLRLFLRTLGNSLAQSPETGGEVQVKRNDQQDVVDTFEKAGRFSDAGFR
jgi:hypothetical protein